MHQVSWCEVICVVMIALLLPAGVLWPPLMWTAHVLCSITPGIVQHTAALPLTCLGVCSSLMAVISSRALLEEDYRKVLEVRLKASLPASSAGYVHLCVGAPNVIICVCVGWICRVCCRENSRVFPLLLLLQIQRPTDLHVW